MRTTVWRYSGPNSEKFEGWFIAFLDAAGCFAVLSDYGDYSYRWHINATGHEDFRRFVLSCGDDYIMGKLAGGEREFDAEATKKSLREQVIELRKYQSIEKWEAREEWDRIDRIDSDRDFDFYIQHATLTEPWNYSSSGPPRRLQAFMKYVMPRLRAAIKADLAPPVYESMQTALPEEPE